MEIDNKEDIDLLNKEIEMLHSQIHILKTRLTKYTNNDRHKKYYEKNKERIKENAKRYIEKLKEENPEKLKTYRQRAYQNRKQRDTTNN
jgi:hypothetical protein